MRLSAGNSECFMVRVLGKAQPRAGNYANSKQVL